MTAFKTFVDRLDYPEIYVGLVGPVGVNMRAVVDALMSEFRRFQYKSVHLKLSERIKSLDLEIDLSYTNEYQRIDKMMSAGNALRALTARNDAFAYISSLAIRDYRGTEPLEKTAFIIDQLKRPEEVDTLRKIYGDNFIQISVFSPEQDRLNTLSERLIQSTAGEYSERDAKEHALHLIHRDEEEGEDPHGQRLRDTFHRADVIIDASNNQRIAGTLSRFMDGLFGYPFITPTRDEYFIAIARIVARRSSDLSRQVGAVIARPTGEVVSLGCNEVPKASGGTYWEGDTGDARDFVIGYDANAIEKDKLLNDIIRRIGNHLYADDNDKLKRSQFLKEIKESKIARVKDALFMDVLEFGRIIHAEMNALTDCVRFGLNAADATLYSTTYPCHICARHIVASGLDRVVYLEPYVKSLAERLYVDSITAEGGNCDTPQQVRFEPFIGIAPPMYLKIFSKGRRKDGDGQANNWIPSGATPIIENIVPGYIQVEAMVVKQFVGLLEEKNII